MITLRIHKLLLQKDFTFLSKHKIMVKLTKYEKRLIARYRGIKDYLNMSEKKPLDALLKYHRITENFSQNGLEQIKKIQHLSLNNLEQMERMNNLPKNKLKQIAETRHIKTNKNTSKEELLISLLKSNLSHTEL